MPTAIEWTDETVNPLAPSTLPNRWACARISPGCDFCYASRLNIRYGGQAFPHETHLVKALATPQLTELQLKPDRMLKVIRRTKPARIFMCDMTDLFGRWLPDETIDEVLAMVAAAPQHTFQLLTKRPARMETYFTTPSAHNRIQTAANTLRGQAGRLPHDTSWPLPNLWLGVSVETQTYTSRIAHLLNTPATIHFISAEPLLGPLNLETPRNYLWQGNPDKHTIDWIIVGGESGGPKERQLTSTPCPHCINGRVIRADADGKPLRDIICPTCQGSGHGGEPLTWVRSLRDQAQAHNVAFFFKQWGGSQPKSNGRILDGQTWSQFPQ